MDGTKLNRQVLRSEATESLRNDNTNGNWAAEEELARLRRPLGLRAARGWFAALAAEDCRCTLPPPRLEILPPSAGKAWKRLDIDESARGRVGLRASLSIARTMALSPVGQNHDVIDNSTSRYGVH